MTKTVTLWIESSSKLLLSNKRRLQMVTIVTIWTPDPTKPQRCHLNRYSFSHFCKLPPRRFSDKSLNLKCIFLAILIWSHCVDLQINVPFLIYSLRCVLSYLVQLEPKFWFRLLFPTDVLSLVWTPHPTSLEMYSFYAFA